MISRQLFPNSKGNALIGVFQRSLLYNSSTLSSQLRPQSFQKVQCLHTRPLNQAKEARLHADIDVKETKEAPHFMKMYTTGELWRYTLLSFVTAQPWLLKLAIKVLPYTPVFLVRFFVCPVYTGGENFSQVRETGVKLLNRGITNMMLSYAVEDADGKLDKAELKASVEMIKQSVNEVLVKEYELAESRFENGQMLTSPASGYVALKPTGIMENSADILANFDNPAYAEQYAKYLDVCRDICAHAKEHGKGKVVIMFDAEKLWLQKGVYDAQRRMMKEFNSNSQVIVAGTLQMYLKHSVDLLKYEIEEAKKGKYQLAMKLVRGAYTHSEPTRDRDIHACKKDTDDSYNEGTAIMLESLASSWKSGDRNGPVSRLIVASHNAESCDIVAKKVRSMAPAGLDLSTNEDVVYGQLLGMSDDQSLELTRRGLKVVKYVPWGPAKATKEYLTRRLEENGDAARGGWDHFFRGCKELMARTVS
ncbi:proline dehydrogenase [Starmerella bacillaris]|uniref:Proline dehydrogenase n=1 Tax=Starmerella bacillaris TaxID=1247836 RepID=A0AAV5RGL5_STABA|nr:proline dehydrogenase [Starmerella bacillaris]